MLFKINDVVIRQAKAAVNKFGSIWLHGDANMYTKDSDSEFRRDFSNPAQEESKYRVKLVKGEKIPDTVKGMEELLMQSRQAEQAKASIPEDVRTTESFSLDDEEPAKPEVKVKGKSIKVEPEKDQTEA